MANLTRDFARFLVGASAVTTLTAGLVLPGELDAQDKVKAEPMSTPVLVQGEFRIPPGTPVDELLPMPPRFKRSAGPLLTDDLAQVPEVALEAPLDKATTAEKGREEIVKLIAKIGHLSQRHPDGFMEALAGRRVDLLGLPFVMGDACRLTRERSRDFAVAVALVRAAQAEAPTGQEFWDQFTMGCWSARLTGKSVTEAVTRARIAALMQVLAPESAAHRMGLVRYLADIPHVESTRALAKLVLFSPEAEVREAAIDVLQQRRERDYTDLLLEGLRYPWPAVAGRAADAVAKLDRQDLIPRLVDLLEAPDARLPEIREVNGERVPVVRELVKMNHLRNCLLCHAPDRTFEAQAQDTDFPVTGAIPIPGEELLSGSGRYYSTDLFVRADVTYLRQDFSMPLSTSGTPWWPEMQRFDFLVRTRVVSEKEAAVYHEKLAKRGPGTVTPYERAILAALRELTGRDTEPTAAGWRKLIALLPPKSTPPGGR
jgi:hypothetical protein